MAIISFTKTLNEFTAGKKTVTRRAWKTSHLEQWVRFWDEGKLIHKAWSALPYVEGAHYLQDFMLITRPYRERLCDMPEYDLVYEGGMCESVEEFIEFVGLEPNSLVSVVRFVPITPMPDKAREQALEWIERIFPKKIFTGVGGDIGVRQMCLMRDWIQTRSVSLIDLLEGFWPWKQA